MKSQNTKHNRLAARLKESQASASVKMPRTRNNWSKPPLFWLHACCQICGGQNTYHPNAGGGRWIGGCHKPRCKRLVDIDAKAAMHGHYVLRRDIADDPLWALFGITPECLLGKAGPAPKNWTVLRSSGTREPGWGLDTTHHPSYAWDITLDSGGMWRIPASGSCGASKGATIDDLKHSLDPAHHQVVDAFVVRLNTVYAAEAADHEARAAFPNPAPLNPSPFEHLQKLGMLPSERPLGTYAVLPVAKPVTHSFCGAPYCSRPVANIIQCHSWEIHSCSAHSSAAILSSKAFMHDRGKVVALRDLLPELVAERLFDVSVCGWQLATDAEKHHRSAGFVVLGDDDVWRVAARLGQGEELEFALYPLSKLLGLFGYSPDSTETLEACLGDGIYRAASETHDAFVRLNRVSLLNLVLLADPLFDAVKAAGGVTVTRSTGAVEKGWSVATEDPHYEGEPVLLSRDSEASPWCMLMLSPDGDTWKPQPVVWLKKVLPEENHGLVDAFIARLDGLVGAT